MRVGLRALKKMSYLESEPTHGRAVPVYSWFENDVWHKPCIRGDEKSVEIFKLARLVRGTYFAKHIVDPEIDFQLPLHELLTQRLSLPQVMDANDSIVADLLAFGAMLEKYAMIFHAAERVPSLRGDVSLLVGTELEFLFYNVRALYDQLQFIIRRIWDGTKLHAREPRKKELPPKSFADVVLIAKQDQPTRVREALEIHENYGLPPPLATFYHEQGEFLCLCRRIRDDVAHMGTSLSDGPIFQVEGGFAVAVDREPYSKFGCWCSQSLLPNRLGSVRALIAHVALHAVEATTRYAESLATCIDLPKPLAPNWHVFVRNPYVRHLRQLADYVQCPWLVRQKGQSQ